ncbi:type 1 pili tip component [Endothiovibrio diazotrophicus]
MGLKPLIQRWQNSDEAPRGDNRYEVQLPLRDAARLAALNAMYPGRGEARMLAELIGAALDEVEKALPYVPGQRVVAEDEFGDPIFEDVGPTPTFCDLTRHFRKELSGTSH